MTTQRQFFTQKQRKRRYSTVEIYQETIGVIRWVNGRIDPLSFGLEASAPRNAGETVEFTAHSFGYAKPDQTQDNPSIELQVGRIGTELKRQLKQIKQAGTQHSPVEVIIREYISGELTTPVEILKIYASTITATPSGVVFYCEMDNPAARQIARLATIEDFNGLTEVI